MIYLTILFPIFTIVVLFIFFRDKTTIWEYALVLFPTIILIWALHSIMISSNTSDVEYRGACVTGIRYYEPWDEYIERTCSKEIPTGTDSKGNTIYRTEYYDCSYIDYHREYHVKTAINHENEISKQEYDRLVKKFATPTKFIDMDRDFHTIDGDMYETKWDGSITKTESIIYTANYKNKIQASSSVFKIEKITDEEALKLKLYGYDQNDCHILGSNNLPDSVANKFAYINGMYGIKHQIHVFILIFRNQPMTIAYKQRSYWEGFNKNEFVVCIGVDNNDKILWNQNFSWEDKPTLSVKLRQHIINKEKLDINSTVDFLLKNVPSMWKRKQFSDFEYIGVELTDKQTNIIITIVLIYNIAISIWIVLNDIDNESFTSKM